MKRIDTAFMSDFSKLNKSQNLVSLAQHSHWNNAETGSQALPDKVSIFVKYF